MEISSHIRISNLETIDRISSDQILLVGENSQGYVNKKIQYSDFFGSLKEDFGSELVEDIKNRIQDWLLNDISSGFETKIKEVNSKIQKQQEQLSSLDKNVGDLRIDVNYLSSFLKQKSIELAELSTFTYLSATQAILRIANCQEALRDKVNSLSSDLSVTFI